MSRWLVVLGAAVAVLLAFLLWKMSDQPASPGPAAANSGKSPDSEGTSPTAKPPNAGKAPVWVNPNARRTDTGDGDGDTELIDPKSQTFSHRVDVVVGDKLRAQAAFDCDESGIDPDAEIKLNYKLRIVNGRISVSDVRVMSSDTPAAYQRCFTDKIEGATFQMNDMPDFEEGDQELFTRVRSMKKYRSRAEFDK